MQEIDWMEKERNFLGTIMTYLHLLEKGQTLERGN